jgi:hypothetical protein
MPRTRMLALTGSPVVVAAARAGRTRSRPEVIPTSPAAGRSPTSLHAAAAPGRIRRASAAHPEEYGYRETQLAAPGSDWPAPRPSRRAQPADLARLSPPTASCAPLTDDGRRQAASITTTGSKMLLEDFRTSTRSTGASRAECRPRCSRSCTTATWRSRASAQLCRHSVRADREYALVPSREYEHSIAINADQRTNQRARTARYLTTTQDS